MLCTSGNTETHGTSGVCNRLQTALDRGFLQIHKHGYDHKLQESFRSICISEEESEEVPEVTFQEALFPSVLRFLSYSD